MTATYAVSKAWPQVDDLTKSRFLWLRSIESEPVFLKYMGGIVNLRHGQSISSTLPDDDLGPAGEGTTTVLCYGFSATYNTKIGLRDPKILEWIHEGHRDDELRARLRTHPLLRACFDAFSEHIQQIAKPLKFVTWAVAMEHGGSSSHPARVHLHAFAGVDISRGFGMMRPPKGGNVDRTLLLWDGADVPMVKYTTFKKVSPSLLYNSITTGMYYVAGAKSSSLFVESSDVPFKELAP
jgi:hypothetical protein